jgi:hypothetical protein
LNKFYVGDNKEIPRSGHGALGTKSCDLATHLISIYVLE